MRLPCTIERLPDGSAIPDHVGFAPANVRSKVLTNVLILLSIVFGHALQLLFYGPLRAMEVEQIYEKAWYAVTETCLAMTIFRDEFDVRFIIMFGVLLFIKCFSWIGSGRVEFVGFRAFPGLKIESAGMLIGRQLQMEQQPPERPLLFHIRLASSLLLLCATCGAMVWHSITAVLERGKPNMMVSSNTENLAFAGIAKFIPRLCSHSNLLFF